MQSVVICGDRSAWQKISRGIIKTELELNIVVYDIKERVIADTKSFIESLPNYKRNQNIIYIRLSLIPSTIDLCILQRLPTQD